MQEIRNGLYEVTLQDNFDKRITTFDSIFKNERDIKKYCKQTDKTLISFKLIKECAVIGFKK